MATELHISASRLVSSDPATGEVLAELETAGAAEVAVAVARARAAQPAWQAAGLRARLRVVREFLRRLTDSKAEVARLVTRESGKPYAEALLTEVLVAQDSAKYWLDNAWGMLRDQPVRHGNPLMKLKSGRIVREPYGVMGIISPWNYPFSIPATEALPALLAGNAVVLKPSEFTPLVALELEKLLHASGVPREVFQVVVGEGGTGAALAQATLDKLIFTGSVATGKRVAQAAAERLLPVVLELGGKDPMLVLEDADVEIASSAAVWGAFMNAGQTCLSVERCYVHRSLYKKFLAACAEKARRVRVGNGMDPETDVGPMIHERQLKMVEAHVEDAIRRGARLLAGGTRLPQLGPNFYAPTVLADVNHEMRIMREETFGPVLPLMAFDAEEEAIRLGNDSEFGLAATVWTSDRRRGERIAGRLQAGAVLVNDVLTCFAIPDAPHGGVKSSGMGRTHGRVGMEEMVRIKYVDSDLLPGARKVWWYGYGPAFSRQLESFSELLFAPRLLRRLVGGVAALRAFLRPRRKI